MVWDRGTGVRILKRDTHPSARQSRPDVAAFLARSRVPEFDTQTLPEPQLIFARHLRMVDPKTGLALYGPYDADEPGRRAQIRLGIIGTGETIDLLRRWIDQSRGKVIPIRRVKQRGKMELRYMDPTVYPPFPGFGEVFRCDFSLNDSLVATLRDLDIEELRRIPYFESRVTRLVEMLVERMRVLNDKPAPPDVIVCAMPTVIRDLCTIASRHKRRPVSHTRAPQPSIQPDLFANPEDSVAEDEPEEVSIFHHGLKARAMEVGIPTQLIWQSTLEGMGEDDATRAWNFWTGVYYKAGNIPWRVEGLQAGTCYVGIAFYVDKRDRSYRSCMAQAFSDQGDGFVMRSDPFKWDELGSPHLTEEMAADLISRVLAEYERHLQHPPGRVVVHKWSRYWPDELAGFLRGIGTRVHSYDLVAFGDRGIRFFRTGENPVLRGTLVTIAKDNAVLYTRGYVPFLGEYSGMRVPRPLEIVEHHGSTSMTTVAAEILALTKMDWNSSAFSGKAPITTAFSEDVGHILAELPEHVTPKTTYRYYM